MPNSVQSYNHSFEHTNCSSPFCKKIEDLNGKSACITNLHLHLHLKECLLDYGPVHGMCFTFERFNGVLGGASGFNGMEWWTGMVAKRNLKIIINLCQPVVINKVDIAHLSLTFMPFSYTLLTSVTNSRIT